MFRKIVKIGALLGLLAGFVSPGFSQETGILSVSVADQESNLLINAKLTLQKGRANPKYVKQLRTSGVSPSIFTNVPPGEYRLEVELSGFQRYSQSVFVKEGENQLTIKLRIAEIIEEVDIGVNKQDKSLDPRDGAFSSILTREQIDNLPDDPKELRRELQRIAGPDAIIRVDGFSGGRLPHKSQIVSIKIIRSSFDAEFHSAGRSVVDIVTRAFDSGWSGALSFNFNDESLNARHPFAPVRASSQERLVWMNLDGPIIKNKASLSLFVSRKDAFESQNIVAAKPNLLINDTAKREASAFSGNVKLVYNLSKNHPLNVSLSTSRADLKNLGVGGFNLQERAFDSELRNHRIRASTSGFVGKRYLHEFRFQYMQDESELRSRSDLPTIIVLDAFSAGGGGIDNDINSRKISIAENLLFGFGRHSFKVGGFFEYEKLNLQTANNRNGTFTFSNLGDFARGTPSIFTQRFQTRRVEISQLQLGVFVQDDIKIHNSLLLSFGLRYELQNNLKDYNNFSPRAGFTWSPQTNGATVLRGGAGVYFNWLSAQSLSVIRGRDRTQPNELIVLNPSFPDASLPIMQKGNLPENFSQLSLEIKNPYVIVGSINVIRRLSNDSALRAVYKYERGIAQFRSRDINAPSATGIRPDVSLGRVLQAESSGISTRHALDIGYDTTLLKNLSFSANYTLSKVVSDTEGIFSLPSDNNNLKLDKSVSNEDRRHRLYSSLNWRVRRGVSFSTIFKTYSPRPFNVTTGTDDNGDTVFNDRPLGMSRNSERGTWFNQVDTNLSWNYSFGTMNQGNQTSRRVIVTAGESIDSDLSKRYSIKLFLSVQNLFNRTNLRDFVGVSSSPFFGQAVSAAEPRKISFGIRFSF